MKGLTRLALIAVAAVGMGLVASAPSWAIHRGAGGLVCGGCHTMHNSQGRTSLDGLATADNDGAGDGSLILLRASVTSRAQIHNLCLQCHAQNGTRATDTHAPHSNTAPKVLLKATVWDQDTSFSKIGAGGDFKGVCGDGTGTGVSTWTCTDNGAGLGKGHSLGATSVVPPGAAEAGLDYLTCTNCHDPHGVISTFTTSTIANTYRMLRKGPTGSGGGVAIDGGAPFAIASTSSYIGGVTGEIGTGNYAPIDAADGTTTIVGAPGAAEAIWPIFRNPNGTGGMTGTVATDSPNSNYYSSDIANWCAACHDNWHEANDGTNDTGAGDWKRHPVNNLIIDGSPNSGATVVIIDPDVDPADDVDDTYNALAAGTAVPVVSGAVVNKTWYLQNATTDRVFCLSCHFPHGSPYNDLLRWNYTSEVGSGTQTGNAIPANRGCQLCHNRGGQ